MPVRSRWRIERVWACTRGKCITNDGFLADKSADAGTKSTVRDTLLSIVYHQLRLRLGRETSVAQNPNSQGGNTNRSGKPQAQVAEKQPDQPTTPEQIAAEQQKRFEEMRSRLLGQDARTD